MATLLGALVFVAFVLAQVAAVVAVHAESRASPTKPVRCDAPGPSRTSSLGLRRLKRPRAGGAGHPDAGG